MRRSIIPIFLVVLVLAGAYETFTTERGAAYISAGLSLPREDEPYCQSARAELRAWLTQHGFSSEPSRGDRSTLEVGSTERVEWFGGRYEGSSPFHVVLIVPETGRSGIHAHVEWFFSGFRPAVTASDRHAQEFAEMLRDWFERYEQRHPLQNGAA